MRLNKQQKISTIISFIFFFVWIITLAMLTRTGYKGSLTNAAFTASVGCCVAMIFYVLIFSGKAKVSAKLNDVNTQKIKSDITSSYIAILYVDIAGFFMMSVASLLVAYDFKQVRKFNWLGVAIIATLCMITVVVFAAYLKISAKERRLFLQEKNDSMASEKTETAVENESQE